MLTPVFPLPGTCTDLLSECEWRHAHVALMRLSIVAKGADDAQSATGPLEASNAQGALLVISDRKT
jgi:hypothetical protein